MREIVFYRTFGGRAAASDFLATLEDEARTRIAVTFQAIRTTAQVPADVLKKLSGARGLWEIRVRHRADAFRFLCFFDGPALIVVATGFAKKSMRLPLAEIRTAEARMQDYLQRKSSHG